MRLRDGVAGGNGAGDPPLDGHVPAVVYAGRVVAGVGREDIAAQVGVAADEGGASEEDAAVAAGGGEDASSKPGVVVVGGGGFGGRLVFHGVCGGCNKSRYVL